MALADGKYGTSLLSGALTPLISPLFLNLRCLRLRAISCLYSCKGYIYQDLTIAISPVVIEVAHAVAYLTVRETHLHQYLDGLWLVIA